MRSTLSFTLAASLVLASCGDKDPDDTGSTGDGGATDGGGTDGGATDGGATDGGATDGGGSGASDAAFWASGTYDGDAFEVDCFFDDSDPDWTASLMCQEDIQFFVGCRLDPEDGTVGGLEPASFQIWFYLHAEIANPGTHNVMGMAGLCVGNNGGSPLCTNSQNIESGSITVDSSTLWSAASGSFEAEWNDSGDQWAGDHTATLTGGFDFNCDG